jgi:nickel-dependent lactate racemase
MLILLRSCGDWDSERVARSIKTMRFSWGYGKGLQEFEVPDDRLLGVVEGVSVEPLRDLAGALGKALGEPVGTRPLFDLLRAGDRVCIVCPDYHRLWTRQRMWLPLLLKELGYAGIRTRDISVIIANGTHRPPSYWELKEILGEDFPSGVKVVNHDASDEGSLVFLGLTSRGTPVLVNRWALEADHLILTGAVVPHTFAGYGGGRKAVLPGISGIRTILANHRLALSSENGIHPMAVPGHLRGNPVHEDMLEAARMLNPTFIVNFILSEEGDFLAVFAGDLEEAHYAGCAFVERAFRVPIPSRADIVVASRGGHPMDLTFYQAFQSSANAVSALREDGEGVLVLVGACSQGLGPYEFRRWFELGGEEEIRRELERRFAVPGFVVYRASLLRRRARRVILVSDLEPGAVRGIGLEPASSVQEALELAFKEMPDGKVLLMPHASQTIPMVEGSC